MKDVLKELEEIAEIAKKQREGRYTTESDAVTALELVRRLALALAAKENAETK